MKKNYEVYIGGHRYYTKADDSTEAKRNAAHQHRNRGYDTTKPIEWIMKRMRAERD